MKRHHYAIITGQILSYALIITFIFADRTFGLTGIFTSAPGETGMSSDTAFTSACLVGIVGAVNVWLTYYYMQKSSTMQDWVVVCAWTHRIKQGNRWFSLEEFLSEQLGCQISHGLSEQGYKSISTEIDSKWRTLRVDPVTGLMVKPEEEPPQTASGPSSAPAAG